MLTRITIEGKCHNLCNRKFCLDCSPFKSGNNCREEPKPRGHRKTKIPYAEWSEKQKQRSIVSIQKRGDNIKAELVALLGGVCEMCGYNKCLRALTFHHKDPKLKSFNLDKRTLASKAKAAVLIEVAKCSLLCCRCHTEVEDKVVSQGFEP